MIPTSALVPFCRAIRMGLEAGLSLPHVFQQQARRGPYTMRPLATRIADRLSEGDSLTDSLKAEAGSRLPPLFLALVEAGEESGHLSDSFRELEDYFEMQYALKRNFRSQIRLPMFQFIAAVAVICLMLLVMGMLDIKLDPIGVGVGPSGAIKFLLIVGCGVGAIYLIYLGISRQLRFLAPVERLVLKTPGVGPALESVLMSRFCTGFRFTMGAGLPVQEALRISLNATSSSHYIQSYQKADAGLKRGEEVIDVLERCHVFPREFLDTLANAEESGQIPEVMAKQAKYYTEDAGYRLKALSQVAGWIVSGCVALFIIVLIFKLYGIYFARFDMIK